MFNALHQKDEFQHIFIYDFLERIIPRGVQYKKRPKVNINEDSDALIEESDIDETISLDLEQDEQDNELQMRIEDEEMRIEDEEMTDDD